MVHKSRQPLPRTFSNQSLGCLSSGTAKTVSALPFRIRLLDQASPLAYSLDIRRPAAYGDSWTGISLGRPAHDEDRTLSSIGINDPLIAEAIARGDAPSGRPIVPATTNKELAARQVAIWAETNSIALTPQTVPNAALRSRAKRLLAGVAKIAKVPLQAASHSVQIFVRDTTANTVQLAVTLGIDANTQSTTPQNIDLYLDGVRCPINSGADPYRTTKQRHLPCRPAAALRTEDAFERCRRSEPRPQHQGSRRRRRLGQRHL